MIFEQWAALICLLTRRDNHWFRLVSSIWQKKEKRKGVNIIWLYIPIIRAYGFVENEFMQSWLFVFLSRVVSGEVCSIYLWFICFPWWSIDGLENLHADRTTVCFEPWQKSRARLGSCKTGLSPPVLQYWPFQGGTSVVVPYCYCPYLYFGSAIMLVTYFCKC